MMIEARGSRLAAAIWAAAGLLAAGVSAPVAGADPGGCNPPWGGPVQGQPGFAAGDPGGVYLWHDGTFHVRVTHRGSDQRTYGGTITSTSPMQITPVDLESSDSATLSPDQRILTFKFNDTGGIDGVDFSTNCADRLSVGPLTLNGSVLASDQIYLGANEVHPENNPLGVSRQAASQGSASQGSVSQGSASLPGTPGQPAVPWTPGQPSNPGTAGQPAAPAVPGLPLIPGLPGL